MAATTAAEGTDSTEFGDYFRTQKYNQGLRLRSAMMMNANIVKNKVAYVHRASVRASARMARGLSQQRLGRFER